MNPKIASIICVLMGLGHFYDLLMGLDMHRQWQWFGALGETYAQWDPEYVAQPFYIKVVSLISGFILMPTIFLMGLGFARRSPWVAPLSILYLGLVVSNNIVWVYTELMGPHQPLHYGWTFGLFIPWVIFPPWFVYVASKLR